MTDDVGRTRDWQVSLLVTLAAVLVYRLGGLLPLYGLDARALAEMLRFSNLGLERISIATLGILPLFSALLIVELAKLAAPWFGRWTGANAQTVVRISRWLALAFAAVQSMGMATALEQASRVVTEPGLTFRAATVVTLVAAVALAMWLADEITRRGIGSGFWLLLCVPILGGLPKSIAAGSELQRMGMLWPGSWAATAFYLALGAAAIVKLDRARAPDLPGLPIAGIWPPILAYTSLGWLTALFYAMGPTGTGDPRAMWYGQGQPFYLVLLALLVVLFAVLRLWRASAAATVPHDRLLRLGVIGGGMQGAILAAGELMQQVSPVAIDGMWLIILVTLMLSIRDRTAL